MAGKVYELRFDGSCWPNPGGRAGYGWVVTAHAPGGPAVIAEGSGPVDAPPGGRTSNNVAEWHALRDGLAWVARLRVPVDRLLVRGDSQLVVHQVNGRWACKKAYLEVYRRDCSALLAALPFPWEAGWVPRAENAAADALSTRRA